MQKIELDKIKLNQLKAILANFNSYTKFSSSKSDAYQYAKLIGVRVCPYCNISYTYTVLDEGGEENVFVCRPDFDHFVAKSIDSDLSKAVENLIPSCLVCNRTIKGRKEFNDDTHLHPFHEDFDQTKEFFVELLSADYLNGGGIKILFKDRIGSTKELSDKADNNIKDLRLVERYEHHKVDVVELLKKAKYYNRQRIREISKLLDLTELKGHLFPEIENDNINSSPLLKLKRDILKQVL